MESRRTIVTGVLGRTCRTKPPPTRVLKIASLFIDRESSSTLHGSGRLVRNCRYYAPDTSSFARSQNSGQQTTKEGERGKEKEKNLGHCFKYCIKYLSRTVCFKRTNLGRINCQLPANERSPRNWVSLIISLIILSPFHSKRIRAISYFKKFLYSRSSFRASIFFKYL